MRQATAKSSLKSTRIFLDFGIEVQDIPSGHCALLQSSILYRTLLTKSDILQDVSNRKKNAKKTAANLGSQAKQVLADAFKEHHPAVYHKPAKRKY